MTRKRWRFSQQRAISAEARRAREENRSSPVVTYRPLETGEIASLGGTPPAKTPSRVPVRTTNGPRHISPEDLAAANLPAESTCSDCKQTKPRADFYLEKTKEGKVRVRGQCKACFLAARKRGEAAKAGAKTKSVLNSVTSSAPVRFDAPTPAPGETPAQEETPVPGIVGDRTPRETDNRQNNKSVIGMHVDQHATARWARWGILLANEGIRHEYDFLAAKDDRLRTIFGGSDEPLTTIRRAIRHNDETILKHVFPPKTERVVVTTQPESKTERLVPRVFDAPMGPKPEPAQAPEPVVRSPLTPRPVPDGPPPSSPKPSITETRIEDAVAAARLLVEADDQEAKLKREIAHLEQEIALTRATIVSVGEQKRRALEMLLTGGK